MTYTDLTREILKKANAVQKEYDCKYLCASHVVVAVLEFCKTKYTGIAFSDYSYPRYEEERLRYLVDKQIKLSSYFRLCIKRNIKSGIQEEAFDSSCCEEILSIREATILSADVLFLCALKALHTSYHSAVRGLAQDAFVITLLQDTDVHIYDYVIWNLEALLSELENKRKEALAIRDWKPAAKFAEPEDLLKQFFDHIRVSDENNVLQITLPGFLRKTDLKLSIYKVNDHFVIHDNGCAAQSLSKQIDSIRVQKVLDLLWDKSNLQGNKLFAQITDVKFVLYFIQEVILTANADLYYEYFKDESFGRRRYIDPCKAFESEQQAEAFDKNGFVNELKDAVKTYYDENKGITLRFDTKYCHCSYGIKVLIETLDDGAIRFSDAYKNKEYETGEMLEAFYFSSTKECDDLYYKLMQDLARPFGTVFDMTASIPFPEYNGRKHHHKNPYMLSAAQNWVQDLCKFMNSAVLISVVADRIHYEKVRKW